MVPTVRLAAVNELASEPLTQRVVRTAPMSAGEEAL